MTNSDAIREFVDKWGFSQDKTDEGFLIDNDRTKQCLSDLTALISEHYYPKEFVKWTFRQRFMSCGHLDFDSSILDLDLEYWHKHIKGKENEQ